MRVIAGRAKGRRLLPVPGEGTRPITDRAKEALFSILGADVIYARVLDLFAGTGGVGIEALSRGARHVTFVEKAGQAVDILRQNLKATRLEAGAQVERADVFRYLEQTPREPFDLPAERAAQGESAGPIARPGNTPTQRGKELCLTRLRM